LQRMTDGFSLRIKHARFQRDMDFCFQTRRPPKLRNYCTRVGPWTSPGARAGKMPSRRATS
jgi:hypothetical protein